jgi:hypothetical protein
MTSFSGNPGGRDGFYFDDLILEYRTENGVATHEIPNSWNIQSTPNPASEQTLLAWENTLQLNTAMQLEVLSASGKPFQLIPVLNPNSNSFKLETISWPAGVYFYRLKNGLGNSEWRRLLVVH